MAPALETLLQALGSTGAGGEASLTPACQAAQARPGSCAWPAAAKGLLRCILSGITSVEDVEHSKLKISQHWILQPGLGSVHGLLLPRGIKA